MTYTVDLERGLIYYSDAIETPSINVETNTFLTLEVRAKQGIPCGDSLKFAIVDVRYWSFEGLIDSVQREDGFVFQGLKGDINLDCEINVLDVVLAVKIVLEKTPEPSECELWAVDINKDESIDVLDVVGIVNVILGIGQYGS